MESHDKRCGRCGANVEERYIGGKKGESCICLISYYDERMPDAWHFAYETRSPIPAGD